MQKLIPALLLLLLAVVSCTKSDDDAAKNPTWTVTLYQVPSSSPAPVKEDKTDLFAGYTFEFNDDNTLVIHKSDGTTVDNANWGIVSGTTTAKLGLDNATAPLDAIIGQWNVIEKSDTDFKMDGLLIGTGPDSNSGEVLHFQKQ